MGTEGPTWEKSFFGNSPPRFDLTEIVRDSNNFKPFPYVAGDWTFGMSACERKVFRSSRTSKKQTPLNLILWLYARKENGTKVTYVAKAVSH